MEGRHAELREKDLAERLELEDAGDLPGGPVTKTPHSQCWGPGFDPWSGNKVPHAAARTQHSQIN